MSGCIKEHNADRILTHNLHPRPVSHLLRPLQHTMVQTCPVKGLCKWVLPSCDLGPKCPRPRTEYPHPFHACRASTQFSSMGNDFSSILRSTHMDSSPKLARVPPDSATAMHMISHLLSTDDFRHINNLPAAPAGGPPAGKNVPAPSLGLPVVGSHRTATASSENQQQHRPQGSNNGSAAFVSHAFAGGFGVGMTPAMGRFVR